MIDTEAYWIHLVTRVVEIAGTAIIVVGAFGSLVLFLAGLVRRSSEREALIAAFRSSLGAQFF